MKEDLEEKSRVQGVEPVDLSGGDEPGGLLDEVTSSLGLFILEHIHVRRGPLAGLRHLAATRVRRAARRLGRTSLLRRVALADALAGHARIRKDLDRASRLEKRLRDRWDHHQRLIDRSSETGQSGAPLERTLVRLGARRSEGKQDELAVEIRKLERERGRLKEELRAAEETVGDLREALDIELAQQLPRRKRRRRLWLPVALVLLAAVVVIVLGLPRVDLSPGPTRPLAVPREHAQGAPLPGGAAVIVAGIAEGEPLASVERFDPRRRAFEEIAIGLARPTFNHALVLLDEQRVLVTGGEKEFREWAYREAVLLDLERGSATEIGLMIYGRRRHRMVRLETGRIFALGGEDDPRAPGHSTIEEFDPDTGSFRLVADLPVYLQDFTACPWNGRGIAIIAGQDRERNALGRVFVFDAEKSTVKEYPRLLVPRYEHTATVLGDGRIVVAGGFDARGESISHVEVLDARTLAPAVAAPMSRPRAFHTAALLGRSGVLVTGGAGGRSVEDEAEVFDVSADRWLSAGRLAESRNNHVMIELEPGVFLLAGGYAGTKVLRSAEIFVPHVAGPE